MGEQFHLLRLTFVRPPPARVYLAREAGGKSSVSFAVAVQVTTDLGEDVYDYEAFQARFVLLSTDQQPVDGVQLSVDDGPNEVLLDPSRSAYTSYRVKAVFPANVRPRVFRVQLEVKPEPSEGAPEELSATLQTLLSLVGERIAGKSSEDKQLAFLRVTSGEIAVQGSDKRSAATEKVQNVLRDFHFPSSFTTPLDTRSSLTIIERPRTDHSSTGQRVWDCAVALSAYLLQHPNTLWPSDAMSDAAGRHLSVIELGSGTGLAAMVAHRILTTLCSPRRGSQGCTNPANRFAVACTDVEVTVGTSLRENLDGNGLADSIGGEVLEWGGSGGPPRCLTSLEANGQPHDLTILASDVLYNPSSHRALLQTLSDLCAYHRHWALRDASSPERPAKRSKKRRSPSSSDEDPDTDEKEDLLQGKMQVLIAYRSRVEGDDGFLQDADSMFWVEEIFVLGDVRIFALVPRPW